MLKKMFTFGPIALTLCSFLIWAGCAAAPVPLRSQGDLATGYYDEDGDMTADLPRESEAWQDPEVLTFAYAPLEEAGAYENIFADFADFLAQKTGKKVRQIVMASNSAGIEAMREGRLHIGSFSSGATCYAVNLAGYVPIAVKGFQNNFQGYRLILLVRKDSPWTKLSDIKGKKVAHANPSSNSGHLAPMALFPQEGIMPGKDYEIVFSGNHENSVFGLLEGKFDMACVAGRSSVFDRMAAAGKINEDDFRIIWQSSIFPTSSFGYAHDLHPELVKKIKAAFLEYRFTPAMVKAFGKTDRFYPITYMRDYQVVRLIAGAGGEKFDEKGLRAMAATEAKTAR